MIVKSFVFCSDQSLNQIRRNTIIINMYPIFTIHIICTKDLAVYRINLRGISANRVLQIFQIWHITNPSKPYGSKTNSQKYYNRTKRSPKDTHKCFSHYL